MIEKKQGLINELVYNQTVYNEGNNTMFINIIGIEFLIDKIMELKTTTKYIKFNPFYRNSRLNSQIEFDEYMFYMECRDNFTEEELESHLTECMDKIYDVPHEVEQYDDMNESKKREANILYPLCKNGDYKNYNQHLQNFKEYLDELIPRLFKEAIEKLDLSQDDMAFGYFCFEVHSG